MITALALALTALPGAATPDINDYVSSNLKDSTMTASVVKGDQRELVKINKDFGQSYRFKTLSVQYKEPLMLRLETKVEETSILYVVNGPKFAAKIPRAKINTKQDLTDSPGRRQTPMDFGVLTPALFKGTFMKATFVRNDRATGNLVFDITYDATAKDHDTSRHRVWIDPDKKYTARREWYDQQGKQKATFLYDNPKQFNGVWLPTQLTVKNMDDKVAGVTKYDSIKVNTGLSSDLFSID